MYIDFVKFGEEVRRIRKSLGLTQKDVYENVNISVETQRRIENGINEPRLSTIEYLSQYYKVDLYKVLSNCRTKLNFLSDEVLKDINSMLRNHDYIGLKNTICLLIDETNKSAAGEEEKKISPFFERYLEAFKKVDFDRTGDLQSCINNTETFLLLLDSKHYHIANDKYLFNIEISSCIFLITLYRRNNDYDKAIKLSYKLVSRLKRHRHPTQRILNSIGTIYLNLAYVYHHLDDHAKVIEIINDTLLNTELIFSNDLYCELLLRKSIALFHLNSPSYHSFIQVFMLSISEHKKHHYCRILKNEYSIDHRTCSECSMNNEKLKTDVI